MLVENISKRTSIQHGWWWLKDQYRLRLCGMPNATEIMVTSEYLSLFKTQIIRILHSVYCCLLVHFSISPSYDISLKLMPSPLHLFAALELKHYNSKWTAKNIPKISISNFIYNDSRIYSYPVSIIRCYNNSICLRCLLIIYYCTCANVEWWELYKNKWEFRRVFWVLDFKKFISNTCALSLQRENKNNSFLLIIVLGSRSSRYNFFFV